MVAPLGTGSVMATQVMSALAFTSMLMRSLAAGSAYPKGVMAVQAAHFSALNTLAKDNRCSAAEIQKDLLPMRILAADIEEASALIALEAANLLAGITDEQFRLNVRHRIAERLAQTSTISAD